MRQGSTHDADTLHLPEHGFPGASSDPSADGELPVAQAVCPSCPEVCMESSQNLGDGGGEPASADCSTGDAHGVGQALAEASQQAVAEIADQTAEGTSHPEEELQAAAADSDPECGKERQRSGLSVEHTLEHSLVSSADALHTGLGPSEQQRDGPELTACSPPVEEQEKQEPHVVPLPPSSSSATDMSLSSCSPTEASYLPTRFSCTANATTDQEKKPMSEVCSGSEARSSSEDPQERQTIHGASPAIVPEAGASSSTRLGSGLDAAAAKQSHQDASEEPGREATEPKREVSRGSEGRTSCADTQESHAKQCSSTERAQEAGTSLWSSFWSALTPVEDTSRVFQDAADVAVGATEEPKREGSRGSQGISSCEDREARPAGPEASADSVQGGELCGLGLVGEAAATDDSFQDPSNHSEEEAEESCVEELPGNEGGGGVERRRLA
ncbi:uncharacterized protein EMH_0089040 [Eimeria mitis]|uniref:Uncharacterized protein n=1 Tax=Eimeria mitis TaxID=44415 RepID=U6KDE1_9EIME|nr:uncharacterized protein EMH_0089040 [Eimeria mitis]CDJ34267.1 hypothetical protein EMH_0089040 [Eimeria mitis]